NQMEEAAKWYAKAVNYAGIDPIHFLYYGKVLMALGKYEDAKIWFKTYAESDPAMGEHFIESCDYAISLRGKPATFRVYKEYLNTTNADFGPAFFGDYIVYSSSRTDIKRTMKKNRSKGFSESPSNQLYITSMDNKGYLRTPTLLQSDFQNNYNEGPVTFSPDGEWVVFTRNIFENGIRQIPEAGGTLAMYIAEVDANGSWKNVKALPFNVSAYSAGYPAFSPNGKLLYFSSNREGGFGGWDLYVAFRTATGWSVPQNLGSAVNTPGDEISPYLNGRSLYFSSDYHHGLGGMDVFRAEKQDGNWNLVYHLGNTINSRYDDYGFIFNAEDNRGYVVSNRTGGQGNEDIYKVRKMTDKFVITVLNESDMRPVEGATVDFSACGEPIFKTNINGKYAFEALAGLGCDVVIKKEGFKPYSLKINSLGERLTRSYEVKLRRIADEYVGKIVDSQTNEAVKEVYVKATNRRTGLTLKTMSNQWGEYKLALQVPEEYTIRYSKAGYVNTHKKVTITSRTDKSLLGVLSFKKSYAVGNIDGGVVASTDDLPDDEIIEELDTPQDEPLEEYNTEEATPKGFAVQVAAYFDEREVNVAKYAQLQEIGNVYKMKDGNAEKVRVGIFASKKEAEDARKTIVRKGYTKAFVVAEEGRQNLTLRVEEEKEPVVQIVEKPFVDYKVRVATYRNSKLFDAKPLSGFGKIEKRKAGKFTIFLLSGFKSLEEAKMTQQKVVNLGYKDAHLVTEDGKKLKKVK
ncbi:MAG TPA: hypothetical protein ENJ53_01055, partial [Phaeodactylibacter sp.]|nr:hypothetical protein [Phaeodactylibacter sp.]